MHCSRLKKSTFTTESAKKKKEAETRFAPRRGRKMRKPNIALVDVREAYPAICKNKYP